MSLAETPIVSASTSDRELHRSAEAAVADGASPTSPAAATGDAGPRGDDDIKSTAVVLYSSNAVPVSFKRLEVNVDLSKPPGNWCRARSPVERSILQALLTRKSQFSSFDMANEKLELLDDMDVISDSENIKKLLKMPYSSAPISLMVHRIGRTLLLDDFDIHRHLLRRQREDWQWLRNFYSDKVAENEQQHRSAAAGADDADAARNEAPQDQGLPDSRHRASACRADQQSHSQRKGNRSNDRNMLSKFLYYSIQSAEETNADQQKASEPSSQLLHVDATTAKESAVAPNASRSPAGPSCATDHDKGDENSGSSSFQRTLVWNFEDIKMLIGTDLPIFGGGSQPAVSLRLRDAATPINVLTGLEYWLDNLMCNVPEVAMCYHLNGIVKQYEKIRTEDLPRCKGSQFSPKRITDVAQNILSFLKSKAAREGHTYWLYKEGNGEVVKLYDLTSLCDSVNDAKQNPFTVPLGMLLYRLARNMLQQHQQQQQQQQQPQQQQDSSNPKKVQVICGLLGNCLLLLDPESHPEVVTTAHTLLSDLYLVDYTEKDLSSESDESDEQQWSSEDEGSHSTTSYATPAEGPAAKASAVPETAASLSPPGCDLQPSSQMEVDSLCLPGKARTSENGIRHFVPFPTSLDGRLSFAVKHISQALTHLDASFAKELSSRRDRPSTRLSGDAIPLPYGPFPDCEPTPAAAAATSTPGVGGSLVPDSSTTTGDSCARRPAGLAAVHCCRLLPDSWQASCKARLLRNAVASLAGLAEWEDLAGSHAAALRHAGLALQCRASLESLWSGSKSGLQGDGYGYSPAPEDAKLLAENSCWQSGQLLRLLRLCGDMHINLARLGGCSGTTDSSFSATEDSCGELEEHERAIGEAASRELLEPQCWEYSWASQPRSDACESLAAAVRCYDEALIQLAVLPTVEVASPVDSSSDDASTNSPSVYVQLMRRCGNAKNELAVLIMNRAAALLNQRMSGTQAAGAESTDAVKDLIGRSRSYLEQGLAAFTAIGDDANTALLLSNCGRLLRVEAQAHAWCSADDNATALASLATGDGSMAVVGCQRSEFSSVERELYCKATELYTKALSTLKSRERSTSISEHIRSELAGAYFSWASLLQDYPPLSKQRKDEVEREFVDLSMKALKYCSHQYQQHSRLQQQQLLSSHCRCAAVHHRLASMYHHGYRTQQDNDHKRRQLRQLAEQHYSRASERLLSTVAAGCAQDPVTADVALELLRVQLERVALTEFLWLDQVGQPSKIIKLLKASLLVFADDQMNAAVHILELYTKGATNSTTDGGTAVESGRLTECTKLITIAASRLRFILLHIVKALSSGKKRQTEDGLATAMRYRMLYEQSLQLAKDEQSGVQLADLTAKFKALLTALRSQREEMGS